MTKKGFRKAKKLTNSQQVVSKQINELQEKVSSLFRVVNETSNTLHTLISFLEESKSVTDKEIAKTTQLNTIFAFIRNELNNLPSEEIKENPDLAAIKIVNLLKGFKLEKEQLFNKIINFEQLFPDNHKEILDLLDIKWGEHLLELEEQEKKDEKKEDEVS